MKHAEPKRRTVDGSVIHHLHEREAFGRRQHPEIPAVLPDVDRVGGTSLQHADGRLEVEGRSGGEPAIDVARMRHARAASRTTNVLTGASPTPRRFDGG